MNAAADRESRQAIARGLAAALDAALAPGASSQEFAAAREVASLLELDGLSHLLDAIAPHVGSGWPAEVEPAIGRVLRMAARCAAAGELEEFSDAERELDSLAEQLGDIEWHHAPSQAGVASAIPTIGAHAALADLPLADEASAALARRVRLSSPAAAALRAALDWIGGESGPRWPLSLEADDSALDVRCELLDGAGLRPAHEVLAAVEGSLGPAPSSAPQSGIRREWIVRVPVISGRANFIMLEQGDLRLAVPAHAVLRMQLASRVNAEADAAPRGAPLLAPLAPLASARADGPVLLLALGLKRAWLRTDRLVWRLPAEECAPIPEAVALGLARAVITEDGTVYAVADPGTLLAGVALPDSLPPPALIPARSRVAPPAPPPRAFTPEAPVQVSAPAEPAHVSAPVAPPPVIAPVANDTEELDEHSVRPLGEPAPDQVAVASLGARRALVAEDSFTARVFLTRLLEQQGFEVLAVERAAELDACLSRGPWHLLCVDVELPDARGEALLRSVRDRAPAGTPLVALLRDEEDAAAASRAGVSRTLRKPVSRESLEHMLARAGLARDAKP
jgi:CheY-like chemotaxis protein